MWQRIFTFLILGVSIYSFYESNYGLGLILFARFFMRIYDKVLSKQDYIPYLERNCNCSIDIGIYLKDFLTEYSQILESIFQYATDGGLIDKKIDSLEKFTNLLLDNYKQLSPENENIRIIYHIKGSNLWKNGEIDFTDTIIENIFIPYDYKKRKKEEEKSKFFKKSDITEGVTIRIVLVNGLVKFQIGDYNYESSPSILSPEGLVAYKTYSTIAEFPLMHFTFQHLIPPRFLGLSAYATDSYLQKFQEDYGNMYTDWKKINSQLSDYLYICCEAENNNVSFNKRSKKQAKFREERERILEENGFGTSGGDDYYTGFEDNDISYSNKSGMWIYVTNYNDYLKNREKITLTDYYEQSI